MSTSLQPSVYQILVDRGWRRYGNIRVVPGFLADSLAYALCLLLDLVHIATSLTIGTHAVPITRSGMLRLSPCQELDLSGI